MMIATWPAAAPRGAVTAFCRTHEISRSQFYEIRALARRVGVVDAVTAERRGRQRRPDLATVPAVEAAAIRIRKELAEQGWDHGPLSVRHTMLAQGLPAPSRATLARVFTRHGMVVPQPSKRPRSSWRRFTFGYVHECWQLDATEWPLAGGSTLTVFQLLDDHSRFVVGSWVDTGETSAGAVAVFAAAATAHQAPLLLLTDNGLAMNPHRRGSTSQLATYAMSLGTRPITSRIYHPQTCGKNERVHQTLHRWLRARPAAHSTEQLQALVDTFEAAYNSGRSHQALAGHTPDQRYTASAKATPHPEPDNPPLRIAHNTVSSRGIVSLAGPWQAHLGRQWEGCTITVLRQDLHVSLFYGDRHLHDLTINPDRIYQSTGQPNDTNRRRRRPRIKDNGLSAMS